MSIASQFKDTMFKKVAVISTAHLTERTANVFLKKDDHRITCYQYEFGWFVNTDVLEDDSVITIPDDLNDCLKWAIEYNVDMIQFDRDGEIVEELTSFDW